MKIITSLQCIFMLFILCVMCLVCCVPQNEDDVTNTTSNPTIEQSKSIETYSAAEMCSNYSQLIYKYINDSTLIDGEEVLKEIKDCYNNYPTILKRSTASVDDKRAAPREFPHMALLGYSKYPSNDSWGGSGSLISNRWILSTASCERVDDTTLVRWARLGDLNYLSETDSRPTDYQIDQRIVHPDFKKPSLYNDIALFHLDQDVEFSSYVRPICLNEDPNWQSSVSQIVISTGWGRISKEESMSPDLLKVSLDIISANLCKSNYATMSEIQLTHGIVEDSMICAGNVDGKKDICGGMAGSSLQIGNANYTCMYTQVGVLSAGKGRCPKKDSPDIYTRVSKFLPWIEQIVWPKSG